MTYDTILSGMPEGGPGFEPCFVFSVHKSGSTMLHEMIAKVAAAAGLPAVSIPDKLFSNGIFPEQWMNDPSILPHFRRRSLYYGFRVLPPVLCGPVTPLESRRFVLLVRDPRDALVSQYFSFGRKSGSHRLPKHNPDVFRKKLESQEDLPIDEYVVSAAPALRRKLETYRDALNFDLGLLRRYEDVYFDKRGLLAHTFAHLGIDVDPAILESVAAKNDVRPEKEDTSKHIRKGTRGDHAEKLQSETIAKLNNVFRDVGAFYGYKL